MNWEAIGAIGESIGAIAVFASLIYVALQIKHYKVEAQANSRDSMGKSTTDVLMRVASDDKLLDAYLIGMSNPGKLDSKETMRFDMVIYSIFETWETTFSQWKRGTLTDSDWAKWERIIQNYFSTEGINEFWQRLSVQFSDEFQDYINDLDFVANYDFFHANDRPSQDVTGSELTGGDINS